MKSTIVSEVLKKILKDKAITKKEVAAIIEKAGVEARPSKIATVISKARKILRWGKKMVLVHDADVGWYIGSAEEALRVAGRYGSTAHGFARTGAEVIDCVEKKELPSVVRPKMHEVQKALSEAMEATEGLISIRKSIDAAFLCAMGRKRNTG